MKDFPNLVMRKIDVDVNKEAKAAAQIKCMPTFIVYKNGAQADKLEGAK